MVVVLGGPFSCCLHRFLHNRSEILDVLHGTERLVLEMRHSMQVVHLCRPGADPEISERGGGGIQILERRGGGGIRLFSPAFSHFLINLLQIFHQKGGPRPVRPLP